MKHCATKRLAPIDAEAVPGGNLLVLMDNTYAVIGRADPTPPADMPRYRWHRCERKRSVTRRC